jgi:AbrB family looped-hinge helix DNA binding protein
MKSSTISQKGQILIPIQLRKKYGLKTGARVVVSEDGDGIKLTPVTETSIRNMAGILKGKNLSGSLLDSRRKDKSVNK